MKRALEIALERPDLPSPAWILLAGELGLAAVLLLSGVVPSALLRALQLFLRF